VSGSGQTSGVPQAGWYLDPGASGQLCWWNGASWTEHFSPHPAALTTNGESMPPAVTRPMGGASLVAYPSVMLSAISDANTLPVWLMASVVAVLVGAQSAAIVLLSTILPFLVPVIPIGIVAILIGLARWDRSALQSRGLSGASAWWILLFPPIGYFIARRITLKKLGIRANAPGNVYVLTVFAAALLISLALAPVTNARLDAASLRALEQQASGELKRETSIPWTVSCPDAAPVSTVGSSFDCAGTDGSGRSVRFTAHVVKPRQFDVSARQQQQ
jgi:hypothetical protein